MLARHFARRLLHSLGVLVAVMVFVFLLFFALGDPTTHILGSDATDAQRAAFSHANGFDAPIYVQFARFAAGVVRLDFGTSYTSGQPAINDVLVAFPNTLILATAAFLIAIIGGIILGSLAAFNENGIVDRIVVIFGTAISSIAEFWTGLLLIVVVAVDLRLLPTEGFGIGAPLVLPAITMALAPMGRLAFVIRTNAIVVLSSPHISPARARGLTSRAVLIRHVLRNAAPPSVAIAGVELTRMVVGGSVVVESVFAWHGIGRLLVSAMTKYDLPVVSAAMFIGAVFVLVLNLILDFVYVALDRRVRYE
jgi:peptide/nickel transport system permease protein